MDALAGFWLKIEYVDFGDNAAGLPKKNIFDG